MTAGQRKQIEDLVGNDLLDEAIEAMRPLLIAQQHRNELGIISGSLANLKSRSLIISEKEMQERRIEIGKAILSLNDRVYAASKILVANDFKKDPIVPLTYLGMGACVVFAAFFSKEEQYLWRLAQAVLPSILGIIILFDHKLRQKSRSNENIAENIREGNLSKEEIEQIRKKLGI